jgi:hypothetical protein
MRAVMLGAPLFDIGWRFTLAPLLPSADLPMAKCNEPLINFSVNSETPRGTSGVFC